MRSMNIFKKTSPYCNVFYVHFSLYCSINSWYDDINTTDASNSRDVRKNMDDVSNSRDASNSSSAGNNRGDDGNSRDVMDGSKIRDPAETIHGCQ